MENKILFIDKFEEDAPLGKAVWKPIPGGLKREGKDVEGVIGIDHATLRIQPLVHPGWGRAGISYGPFKRQNGLAFGVHVLNGHNTAQSGHLLQGIPQRFKRWFLGSSTENPISNVVKMAVRGDKRRQWRQIRRWVQANRDYINENAPGLDENLAIGWFAEPEPMNPAENGNAFVIHATGPENGELWTTFGRQPMRTLRGLQNIPLYYIVILRETGAAYYAASLPGAYGVSAYPNMRPLAIEPFSNESELYAAAWQSVMGQIGFWVDTRIYGAGVARLAAYGRWYGTAEAADPLNGEGDLHESPAEIGGRWQVVRGRIVRTPDGIRSEAAESVAVLELTSPLGLLHMLLKGSDAGSAGFVWRWRDENNYWQITAAASGGRLCCCREGELEEIAVDSNRRLQAGRLHSLQVVENGPGFAAYLDGQLLFDRWFSDERLAGMQQAGIVFCSPRSQISLEAFEVHPAELRLPEALDFGPPWIPGPGRKPVVRDDFSGEAADLSDKLTTEGGRTWSRILGSGRFILSGDGHLQVDATEYNPNPNRTAYTIPWHKPDFADVRVCITPPGAGRGEWHRGRGGVIFWQDEKNYLIVNTWLDDYYEGASLSSFFFLNGYEDIYDAVWTNVGRRIVWGRPYHLRVSFDGLNYLVHLDEEPVLYRALTDVYPDCQRLSITQVGLVANWEWGHDTGSQFANFSVFAQE